jgi:NAD+ diphosphatase
MPEVVTYFSGNYLDRAQAMRGNEEALAVAWEAPETRLLVVWDERCLIREAGAARLSRAEFGERPLALNRSVFLGLEERGALFAVGLEDREEPKDFGRGSFAGLRELISQVPEREAALLAYARALVHWHHAHRFCGVCGAPNERHDGGFMLQCSAPACSHRSFPRLDPAIIVLTHSVDRCLLGRQPSWPESRFSTIAGFVEPGESLEDAVRREVLEETNVRVGDCRYIASQPWPFPASLMIGFHATAISEDIRLNDSELAEARWVSRPAIAAGAVVLPPKASVAYRLIEAWFDEQPGPRLAEVHRDRGFFRRPDQPAAER